jgi:divalent metal cation (Fe/Co/Zn/Cd) transporter
MPRRYLLLVSDHGHNRSGDAQVPWWRRVFHRFGHVFAHGHDHGPNVGLLDTGAVGIRAAKISLVGLGITAAIQAVIVVFSGSVALLSDTLRNVTDALTAIPLWIAFALGRRPATRRYTYGLNRAEDAAGFVIVAAIAVSAALVIIESLQRLVEPRLIDHIPCEYALAFAVASTGTSLLKAVVD